jgi:hypothetical protein
MPLTNDEMDTLNQIAHACDGEPASYFTERVAALASLSDSELFTLSGMFLNRHMPEIARFIANYAHAVEHAEFDDQPRPDPAQFLTVWEAEQAEIQEHSCKRAARAAEIGEEAAELEELAELIATATPNPEGMRQLMESIAEGQRDNSADDADATRH